MGDRFLDAHNHASIQIWKRPRIISCSQCTQLGMTSAEKLSPREMPWWPRWGRERERDRTMLKSTIFFNIYNVSTHWNCRLIGDPWSLWLCPPKAITLVPSGHPQGSICIISQLAGAYEAGTALGSTLWTAPLHNTQQIVDIYPWAVPTLWWCLALAGFKCESTAKYWPKPNRLKQRCGCSYCSPFQVQHFCSHGYAPNISELQNNP